MIALKSFSEEDSIVKPTQWGGAIEEVRLSAFEKGYQDGWADAHAAFEKNRNEVAADLIDAVKALEFKGKDFKSEIFSDLNSMISVLLDEILPVALKPVMLELVSEAIESLQQGGASEAIYLHVSDDQADILNSIISNVEGANITLQADASLSESQAVIRYSAGSVEVDVSEKIKQIENATKAYLSSIISDRTGDAND